ncbi:MAG: T9SS type A sorting domain-containing protein [bacterium]|nr:T9SS type A sorting domain-containing protein [bacterium]
MKLLPGSRESRWCCCVALTLALAWPALADTASPLYQYQTKATVARYDNGLATVGQTEPAARPVRPGALRTQTDPVMCATDYVWCPTNPAIGCDTSPDWCFFTDPQTCTTNIEWCHTDPSWGCQPTTDPAFDCSTDPGFGCVPTDPFWGCTTDPAVCLTDPFYCATDPQWCFTDPVYCSTTDPAFGCVPTDPQWCVTDPQWCATDPVNCMTDPVFCATDPQWCVTDFMWCATDPQWCATDPQWCLTDPVTCPVVGAEERPSGLFLSEPVPNPFNPFTTLSFSLPETGAARLAVYDLSGRLVKELVNGLTPRGTSRVLFDGSELPSGLYVYILETQGQVLQNKMLLVK